MGQQIVNENLGLPRICAICRQEVEEGENLILCPFCNSAYHRRHLEKWMMRKQACPVCRKGLKGYNLGFTPEKTSPRLTNNLHEPRRHHTRSTTPLRYRQSYDSQQYKSEKMKSTNILKLIAGLAIFWLTTISFGRVFFLVGTIVFVPLIFYLFSEWYTADS